MSRAIEKQTVAQAQEEVRRKVADQEQPRIQDLTGSCAVGVELTEAQQSAVLAKMAARMRPPQQRRFLREYGPWLPGKEAKSASREARSGLATAPDRRGPAVAREDNDAK